MTWRPDCGVAMYVQRHDAADPFRCSVVTRILLKNVNAGGGRTQVIESQEPSIRHDFVTAMVKGDSGPAPVRAKNDYQSDTRDSFSDFLCWYRQLIRPHTLHRPYAGTLDNQRW